MSAHPIVDRAKPSSLAGDPGEASQKVERRPGQPIETRDHQHVVRAEHIEDAAQLQPVRFHAARGFLKHIFAAGCRQRGHLCCDALSTCRNSGVAVNHASSFAQELRTEKAKGQQGLGFCA